MVEGLAITVVIIVAIFFLIEFLLGLDDDEDRDFTD